MKSIYKILDVDLYEGLSVSLNGRLDRDLDEILLETLQKHLIERLPGLDESLGRDLDVILYKPLL
jgi:hypothetical protein